MPKPIDILLMKAGIAMKQERFDEAEQLYATVLAQAPGNALAKKGMAALQQHRPVLRPPASPSQAEAARLIGLLNAKRLEEAIRYGETLAASYPQSVALCSMLGSACLELRRPDRAIPWLRKAAELNPGDLQTLFNIANTLDNHGDRAEAVAWYDRILALRPDAKIWTLSLDLKAQLCDWNGLRSAEATIASLGVVGDAAPPFALLPLEDEPARHRLRSERYAADRFKQMPLRAFALPEAPKQHLRIGYFSPDFYNHPVGRLIARTIELHDRAGFEIHGYSFGTRGEDDVTRRVAAACDSFHDIRALSDQEVAELARRHGLDIAIDLTGYTTHMRTGIFAWRAAPVQISYLGYPGTMGAPFIDYIVADRNLIPEDCRQFYTESPIYLPDVYQAQDDLLAISSDTPSRATLGLPEDGFVFCAINKSYKITPAVFDIWMRLLAQVDNSVLWLLRSHPLTERNLRREAAERGINPERLIFADHVRHEDYLARFRQADLFLDSFTYNAGATASNALWAGLPVLTRTGRGYTARMATSLLNAIDMSDLVTASDAEYEALALDLARDPAKLSAIRARLAANLTTTALFDSRLFTAHLEQGYALAWQRYAQGLKPDVINVPRLPS